MIESGRNPTGGNFAAYKSFVNNPLDVGFTSLAAFRMSCTGDKAMVFFGQDDIPKISELIRRKDYDLRTVTKMSKCIDYTREN